MQLPAGKASVSFAVAKVRHQSGIDRKLGTLFLGVCAPSAFCRLGLNFLRALRKRWDGGLLVWSELEFHSVYRAHSKFPSVKKVATIVSGYRQGFRAIAHEKFAVRMLCEPILDEIEKEIRSRAEMITSCSPREVVEPVSDFSTEKRRVARPFYPDGRYECLLAKH